tara:strand:+ start:42710 stop:42910 length:201 start_codon:yes stop_codon:yes gene_type:complete
LTRGEYRILKTKENPLFMYYLEMGGKVKDIDQFEQLFSKWCMMYRGVPSGYAEQIIFQFLDKKFGL